jgi:hypothetical protein
MIFWVDNFELCSPILHTFRNAYSLNFLIFDFDELLSLLLILCNV